MNDDLIEEIEKMCRKRYIIHKVNFIIFFSQTYSIVKQKLKRTTPIEKQTKPSGKTPQFQLNQPERIHKQNEIVKERSNYKIVFEIYFEYERVSSIGSHRSD